MTGNRAAVRYAKAVLSLAGDKKLTETVNADMMMIKKTIAENDELNIMLKSSVLKGEIKLKALNQTFSNVNGLTKGLFDILLTNKRMDILEDVAEKYNELYDKLTGKEKATVITAIPMTPDMEIKVLAKVKELTSKAVELKNIVDESILGGFILRIGDKQYNASIANQLSKLKREFTLN